MKCKDVNELVALALAARGKTEEDVLIEKIGIDGGRVHWLGGYNHYVSFFDRTFIFSFNMKKNHCM